MKSEGHIHHSTSGKFFFPQLHFLPPSSHPSFWQDSGNTVPEKQPPSAACVELLLAEQFKEYKIRSHCCFKQRELAFVFENLIKKQLLSGHSEVVILGLRAEMGIQQWPFIIGMRELLWTTPFLLSAELLGCPTRGRLSSWRQQNLK